jgi:hypothetical protein
MAHATMVIGAECSGGGGTIGPRQWLGASEPAVRDDTAHASWAPGTLTLVSGR